MVAALLHGDRIEKSTFNRHCERPWGAWQSRNEAFRPHKWSLRVYIGLDCRGLKGLAMTFVVASYVLDVALHATRLAALRLWQSNFKCLKSIPMDSHVALLLASSVFITFCASELLLKLTPLGERLPPSTLIQLN